MRHAKSDWSQGGLADHDRPLNNRGIAAARTMGIALADLGEEPDFVYTSTANRAVKTVELAAEAGAWDSPIELRGELYGASVEGALGVASMAPRSVERLMLVGHQPVWGALVNHLTAGSVQMKTATIVGIDCYAVDWEGVLASPGELVFVLPARMFANSRINAGE